MTLKKTVAILATTTLVAACQPYHKGGSGSGAGTLPNINKQTVGGLAGAAMGAIAGSNVGGGRGQIAAIAIGTLLGAKLGASVGESLDRADVTHYNKTSQSAMETGANGQSFPWNNAQSGNSGVVTPQRYYQTSTGQYCREYTQSINIGGRIEEGHGTACREPDGSWKIVDNAR